MTVHDQELHERNITELTALGSRFGGIDVTFRRWPPREWCRAHGRGDACWRIRVVHETDAPPIVRYGATFNEAAAAVLAAVSRRVELT